MITAAKVIKTDLLSDTALQAVIQQRHYWELAPDSYQLPLLTFSIIENPAVSKDRTSYSVAVRCFANIMSEAASIAELVKTALKNTNYNYRGGKSGYTDTETREGYVELNFNFNI